VGKVEKGEKKGKERKTGTFIAETRKRENER
jgi:hypothetical protein